MKRACLDFEDNHETGGIRMKGKVHVSKPEPGWLVKAALSQVGWLRRRTSDELFQRCPFSAHRLNQPTWLGDENNRPKKKEHFMNGELGA
ncbi:MAG: hypothetical protein JRG97_01175 [Deltaproteobacteria bacterium]|nr:hypothetical protein [Deltaproteobacteria bacterium]